jgi:hypothetical protein
VRLAPPILPRPPSASISSIIASIASSPAASSFALASMSAPETGASTPSPVSAVSAPSMGAWALSRSTSFISTESISLPAAATRTASPDEPPV